MDTGETTAANKPPKLSRGDFVGLPPYREPKAPSELRIAAIWGDVLNVDRVGLDDDFFALGGDSLAATIMFGEIERVLGSKVSTAVLVRASTVAALAQLLRVDPRTFSGQTLVPIRRTGSRPPLVLVHGHNGRIDFVRRLAWLLATAQPVYAMQARGFDGSKPHDSVADMVEDYANELLRAFGAGEIYLGGYCYGGILAIEIERRLQESGLRVRRLITIDPPVFPRGQSRAYTDEELAELARVHSEGLVERLDQMAGGNPELMAWYSPGGQGYVSAMHVAECLAKAYAGFVPTPTSAPLTMIWSSQFAYGLKVTNRPWRLAAGPSDSRVVRLDGKKVTHHMLMRVALREVARHIVNILATDRRSAAGRS